MSQTESKIKLIFEGAERGVTAAAMKAKAAIKSLGDEHSNLEKKLSTADTALTKMSKGVLALGAVHPAIAAIGGVAGATAQLSGAAALIPGVALAGAAAFTTLGLATSGFSDAIGAVLQGDWKTFDKLVGGMAPKAAEAAKGIGNFVAALRMKVQTAFWGEFSKNLDGIGVKAKSLGQIYAPILQNGLMGIASGMAHMIAVSGQAMKSPIFSGAVSSILGNTEAMFRSMSGALGNFLTGFVMMGKAGASYLPQFGNWLSKITNEFKNWASSAAGQKQMFGWISGAVTGFRDLWAIIKNVGSSIGSIFTGLGGTMASPLANLRELTASMAAFLKSAEGQEVLRNLGTVLQQVSTAVRDSLGTALRIVGPLLEGLLSYLASHPDVVATIVPGILAATAALKGLKVALEVKGWIDGAVGALGLFGGKAGEAEGKVRGFAGGLGLLKGALAIGGVAALAVGLDQVNVAAAGGADKLGLFQGQLHNLVGAAGQLASGDIPGIIRDIGAQVAATNETWKAGQAPAQQWSLAISKGAVTAGTAVQNFFRGLVGLPPLPPVRLDVDPTAGTAHVNDFVGGISRRRGVLQIDGDINPATGKITQAVTLANGSRGTMTVDGNRDPADGKIHGTVQLANGSRGTVTIDGNQQPANGKVTAAVTYANGSRGTIQVDANTAAANSRIAGLVNNWNGRRINLIVTTTGSGGIASAGRLAAGGPVVGPGTGTSDTAGLFALSAGEYVATAKQVRAAGGTEAFGRLMQSLERGSGRMATGGTVSPMRASAQAAMRSPSPSGGSSGGGGAVVQFVGNTSDALATVIMGMIRTGKIQIKAA